MMNPQLRILNPSDFPEWNNLLLKNGDYSIFQTSNWAEVLSESYGYIPRYFALFEDDKLSVAIPVMEIKSILTGRRGVSLPFSDYCEPVSKDSAGFETVFRKLTDYGKKDGWKYIELRGEKGIPENSLPHSYYYSHTLKLSLDEEKVFMTFRDSTKRNIKKAAREGVKIERLDSVEAIEAFYRLNCITRKEHGLPPQPYSFFINLYERIILKGLGTILLASLGKNPIAGAVCMHFGKKAIYKFGASEKKFQRLRANNLVMWEAIKWYAKNGYETFNFGKTEPENSGLRQFKAGWGTEEETIKYYRYDLRKNEFVSGGSHVTGIHNKLFNNMPIPVSRVFSSIFYKHVG